MKSRRIFDPRLLILGLLPLMLLASLLCSITIRAGHADSPIAVSAMQIQPIEPGERAPRFFVETIDGEPFEFDPTALARPTIVITFRGGWCPYCNLHLSELRHVIPQIHDAGIDVLFLSGDRPEILYKGLERETREYVEELDFRILSDANANAAIALGIAFTVQSDYIEKLYAHDKDIDDSSITRRGVLPVPAVFAIDADGIVAFAYTNPDYKVRLPADELLDVATRLSRR